VAVGIEQEVAVVGRSGTSARCVLPASLCPAKTPRNGARSGEEMLSPWCNKIKRGHGACERRRCDGPPTWTCCRVSTSQVPRRRLHGRRI